MPMELGSEQRWFGLLEASNRKTNTRNRLGSECSGEPGTRKPILLRSDDRREVVRSVAHSRLYVLYCSCRCALCLSVLPLFCCSCPRACMFAFVGLTVNSVPGFGWVIYVGAGGSKWGADSNVYN
ncbi:hypothetical protein CDL15_Pgr016783 [Punica granatum]|uniref:Uncharacterized protein n=1 Tax=Punica granatum TaxID=22663 RepID=A0A218WXV5_PUNGR|nr:hypothetical protein CDL15_Pgr016783 [Punica granatum]